MSTDDELGPTPLDPKIFSGPISFLLSAPELRFLPPADVPEVAFAGRSNVGKSSLLNKLAGSERVVVDNVAGTTRDPVDEYIELGDKTWRFVDTAGIRRRVHQTRGADFYASLRTQTALEKAEVAVVPGEAFGTPGYLRMSYALGDDDLTEGVGRMQRLLGSAG